MRVDTIVEQNCGHTKWIYWFVSIFLFCCLLLKLKSLLFYDRVVYYYTRIFLIPTELCSSHSPGQIQGWTQTTWSFASFSHQRLVDVFHWCLSNSKSSQFSRTLLRILADFNNVVVWMVSIVPLISDSSNLFTYSFGDGCKCIVIIITPLEFFPSADADGFSLKSEWQQVSSSLFSVCKPSSIMLSIEWSPLFRQLLNPPDPLIIL